MNEMVTSAFSGTLAKVYSPSMFVIDPSVVPCIATLAPITGSPFSSRIFPLIDLTFVLSSPGISFLREITIILFLRFTSNDLSRIDDNASTTGVFSKVALTFLFSFISFF